MMKSKENIENTENQDRVSIIKGFIDSGAKLSAFLLGIIYVCGFLTLNSYFFKYGVTELGIASSDYLIAGSIFVLYLVTYGIFGGRAIVFMKSWMGKHIDQIREKHSSPLVPIIPFLYSFVDVAFYHCLSAAIFSSYAFGQFETAQFYSVLAIVFIISYFLDNTNIDIKYPLTTTIIELITKSFAVYSFFNLSTSLNMFIVFASFVVFSFYINLILDQFERYKLSRDRVVFTFIFSAIFFLGSAVTFGSAIYGNISKKIGGGKSIEIEIGIYSEKLGAIGKEFGNNIIGDVIYSSKENVYLKKKDKTIVIPRTSIQWMRFKTPEKKGLKNVLGIDQNKNDNEKIKKEANKPIQ